MVVEARKEGINQSSRERAGHTIPVSAFGLVEMVVLPPEAI
jgi:hypothetical protein